MTDDNNSHIIRQLDIYDYTLHFRPTVWPAALFVALFSVVTLVSAVLAIRQTDRLMYLITFAGVMEVIGYILRLVFFDKGTLAYYIASNIFILLPPLSMSLVNYLVVGRIVQASGKPVTVRMLSVSGNRIATTFFRGNIICSILQITGGIFLSFNNVADLTTGKDLILAGLCIQLIIFSGFIYVLYMVSARSEHGMNTIEALQKVFIGLWLTSLLIYIRVIYRIVAVTSDVVIAQQAWTSYVFESALIFAAFVAYCYFHFGDLLSRKAQPSDDRPLWILQHEEFVARSSSKITKANESVEVA